jgi:hypothetical protein
VGAYGPGRHVIDLSETMRLAPGVYHVRLARDGRVLMRRAVVLK